MPYDITIKKVAIAGASGNVGSVILGELLKSGLFDITVLTRQSSNHKFSEAVTVARVDYDSLESLTTALTGQDALVSTLSSLAISNQILLFDAAVKNQVKRIIPSEFGCDLHNPKTRALPVYSKKVEMEEYLLDIAKKGLTSYTLVFNGPLLDLGLRNGMFFNFADRTAELYDGGEVVISTSRLASAGKAVRRILTHPRETAGRAIWIKDIDITQKQLLELAQALTPGQSWDIEEVDTADLEQASLKQMQEKEMTQLTMLNFLRRGIFGKGYNGQFEKVHNGIFGIKNFDETDLEELVASIFGPTKMQ